MQQQLGEPALSLKQDVVTRRNSTYDMLKRILDVKNSLMSTIAINYLELKNITNEEVVVIGQVCELLRVFKDCTEEISSENRSVLQKSYF
jgi:7-cyano-7-deazaguanine synthase in queuosine biosynthesis